MSDPVPSKPAWDAGTLSHLEASFCGKCRRQFVPVRPHCAKCRGRTERIYLDGRGKLKTFTTLYVTPDGFTPPLILGICELDGGIKVLGEISDYRLKDSLVIDDIVRVTEKDGKYVFRLERSS